MNPILNNIYEEHDILKFTLSGLNVSLANALRRTLLSDIPVIVLGTDLYNEDACKIEINTGRLHNELVKQRLGNIPVHVSNQKEMETFLSILSSHKVKLRSLTPTSFSIDERSIYAI